LRYAKAIFPKTLIFIYHVKTMEFCARDNVLKLLDKRADGLSHGYRQNVAILGEELIGKTSLIHSWLSRYHNNLIVAVYLEVKALEINLFSEQFIGRFLFAFLKNSQIPLQEDIGFLMEHAQKYIPKTIAAAKEILSARKSKKAESVFTKLLELPELFFLESGKRCIIIFDEFHQFDGLKPKGLYKEWRERIMFGKNTMYVLLSSKKLRAQEILSSELALLFGNFEKIELAPFDAKASHTFVCEKLKDFPVSTALIDFIVSLTAGKPFYLNAVATAFADYHTKNASVAPSIDTCTASLKNILLDPWGIVNKHFSGVIDCVTKQLGNALCTTILLELCLGMKRITHIAHTTGKTKKEAAVLLERLCAMELVVKNSDHYCLIDKFFSFWLQSVYAHQLHNFSADSDKQTEIFRKEVKRLFLEFCDAQDKAISERLMELFSRFSNEAVEIHHKRVRLNHFKEVKLLKINGKKLKEGILARAPSNLWIAGFKEERVSEEDIIDFVNACKRFKYAKSQKRIFIAFDDIDANARLIAKEAKIATWDMACVNSLLDMYDRPRIVR